SLAAGLPPQRRVAEGETMDETEWVKATDPQAMLEFLQDRGKTDKRMFRRKLRLFACACGRRVWHLLTEEKRAAIEVGEQYADGLASKGQLEEARQGCRGEARSRPRDGPDLVAWCSVSENIWIAAREAASETIWWADARSVQGGWQLADMNTNRQ